MTARRVFWAVVVVTMAAGLVLAILTPVVSSVDYGTTSNTSTGR